MGLGKRSRSLARSGFRSVGLVVTRVHDAETTGEVPLWARNARDERHITAVLAGCLREDANCVDVGANLGVITEQIVRLAPQGRHLAFEPIPHLAAELRRRFPSVEVHQAALSDTPGTASFGSVPQALGLSGFRPRVLSEVEVVPIPVEVRTLDDVVAGARVDFLKVDVEGAELAVLAGATATLSRSRPVVVFEHTRIAFGADWSHELGPADFATSRAIFDLLVGTLDYRLFDLDGQGPLTAGEFEAHYESGDRFNFLAAPR